MATDSTKTSLELLYHTSRELASAIDLRLVLQRVLLLALGYVDGERGSIVVLDDSGQAMDSVLVYRSKIHANNTSQLRETVDKGLAGWVARSRKPTLIVDTSRDERWLRRPDDLQSRSGPKSAICVPLMARERLVGVLTVVHPRPGYFTEEHLALIQAVADQAGITVLNARLFDESQRQARVMTALAESAVAMNASLQLVQVLQRILDQTAQALRVETVLLALTVEKGKELEIRAVTSTGKEKPAIGLRIPYGEGIGGRVAETGQGMIVPSTKETPVTAIPGVDIQALVCAPVHMQGKIIGILEAINPLSGAFDNDALLVLSGIGSLAGIAIHNAQLYEQVNSTQRRYQELFEDSINPILITDCKGKILEVNRQAAIILRSTPAALQKKNIAQVHEPQPDKTGPGFEHISDEATISYESRVGVGSVNPVPVEVHVRKVRINGSDCMQWILRDISERKDLDALREDLIAMVYHDLRSPLANVVSSLDVMETLLPPEGNGPLSSVLKIAVRSTDRIQRLVNSLLDITRIESGQTLIRRSPVDPHILAADALDAVQPLTNSKSQQVIVELPDKMPILQIDEDMIRRVLINLLENAVKFSPSKSQISIGARCEEDIVEFWVQDSGAGIPAEMQEKVFEKFTRLRPESGPKGLGLGLAFCRMAVEAHGGKIWVKSKPNKGSRFLFTLPVNVAEGTPDNAD